MKKQLSAFILFLLCALTLSAQEDRVKKKVNLKDGTEMIGFVSYENGMTKITTEDGDVFYYMTKEIKGISSLEGKVKKANKKDERIGYFGTVGLSSTMGSFTGRVTTIHGYRYKGFHIGAGIGLGYGGFFDYYDGGYDYYTANYFSAPIFLHFSQEFSSTKVAPYIAINAGYDFMAQIIECFSYWSYAIMAQFSAGLNFKIKNKSLRLEGGYDLFYGPAMSLYFKF